MHSLVKRTLAAVVALGLTFSAMALTLQFGTTLELRNDAGDLIGVGKVEEGGLLTFDLLPEERGFATLTVIDPVGVEETYDVLINESGEVVVVIETEMVPLERLAGDAGLTLDLQLNDGTQGLGGAR